MSLSRTTSRPLQPARFALLLALLAALVLQQWVARTHIHGTAALGGPAVTAPAGDSGEARGHDCLLCQVAAHAGALAPPAQWLVPLAEFIPLFVRLPAGIASLALVPPAHAWQSRGPPHA